MTGASPIAEIRLSLYLASVALDRALSDPHQPDESGVDLHAASYGIHRALVALGPLEAPPYPPPRVVALTLDEAVVAVGVLELLCESESSSIGALARSSIEKLRARVRAVRGLGWEGWSDAIEG